MSVGPSAPRALLGAAAALALGAAATACWAPPAAAGTAAGGDTAFTIRDPRITESSGLAASTAHPGIVYTHNDSGGVPKIYALGPDGRVRAVLTLGGASARDWEGMALGKDERGRPAIYMGDIGDNLGGAWPYVTVYRIPEPARIRSQTIRATAFKIKYADGPRNAETLMVNPRTNRLYIASKLFGGALYEAPKHLRTSGYNVMHKIGKAPAMATDGAFAPDGSTCVIRTYFGARMYAVKPDGSPGKSLRSVSLPFQPQGESITYTADGRYFLAGSEGENQPVYKVSVPGAKSPASPSASAKTAEKTGKDDADQGHRDAGGVRTGLFVALAIAACVGYGLFRRRG
ncbi:hypothetical protein F8568_041895 [Actinomadura sp. LD22]|uniref:WD40 repeat domain-containing protein n=1 Tax=Actinomadura physcomitrii TaxID=2650748 RepID=A0A6I4MVV4_9ACTN|nr:hypothetical protein [Actinomadura physcomitrii]MWA06789.1 hypothetical protein [Actinomadura physcomitrii]